MRVNTYHVSNPGVNTPGTDFEFDTFFYYYRVFKLQEIIQIA